MKTLSKNEIQPVVQNRTRAGLARLRLSGIWVQSAARLLLALCLAPPQLGAAQVGPISQSDLKAGKAVSGALNRDKVLVAPRPLSALIADNPAQRAAIEEAIRQLDQLDRGAYQIQAELAELAKERAPLDRLAAAVQSHDAAKAGIVTATDDAWSLFTPQPGPTLLQDPMTLAFLDLQIEVRQRLGPRFHTLVPGLEEDRGCAGDFVVDRLIYAYGAAASSVAKVVTADGTDASVSALFNMAKQIACLGARQLGQLERAVTRGFAAVEGRMVARGLDGFIPAFARLVAPVQVLILDARKHAGQMSESWHWFASYGGIISESVTHAGWATDELLVWDRRHGVLVGFPGCQSGTASPECVNFQAFLRSVQDPRALGLGNCGFAGMLSKPMDPLGGESLYTCPINTCENSASQGKGASSPIGLGAGSGLGATAGNTGLAGQSSLNQSQVSTLTSMWSLSGNDLAEMGNLCRGGQTDLQGVNFSLEDCFTMGLSTQSPFDTYTACMSDALGIGESLPEVGSQLQGVPMGKNCGLMDGGAPSGTEENPMPADGSSTSTSSTADNGGSGDKKTEPEDSGVGDAIVDAAGYIWDAVSNFFGSSAAEDVLTKGTAGAVGAAKTAVGGAGAAVGVATGMAQTVLSEEGAQAELGLARVLTENALRDAWMDGRITDQEYMDHHGGKPGDIAEFLKGKQQDCVDATACSDGCTGLGQQLNAVQDCTENFLQDAITQSGLKGSKEVPKERSLAPYSYPRPDDDPSEDTSEVGACLGANNYPAEAGVCGLVLCNTQVSSSIVGGCSCGESFGQGWIRVVNLCAEVRCADGLFPDESCTCRGVGAYEPLPPRPEPPVGITAGTVASTGQLTSKIETGRPIESMPAIPNGSLEAKTIRPNSKGPP